MLLSQAHAELRNLYTVHTEGLIHALMRQSVSLLRQQEAAGAVGAARQAFELVRHLRCLPLLQAQAAALLGHCCTVHSHLGPHPAAGEALTTLCMTLHKSALQLPGFGSHAVLNAGGGSFTGLKHDSLQEDRPKQEQVMRPHCCTNFAVQSSHMANILQTNILVRT